MKTLYTALLLTALATNSLLASNPKQLPYYQNEIPNKSVFRLAKEATRETIEAGSQILKNPTIISVFAVGWVASYTFLEASDYVFNQKQHKPLIPNCVLAPLVWSGLTVIEIAKETISKYKRQSQFAQMLKDEKKIGNCGENSDSSGEEDSESEDK